MQTNGKHVYPYFDKTGKYVAQKVRDTETKDFWIPILMDKTFYEFVKNKYSIGQVDMIKSDDLDKALEELDFEEGEA